MPPHNLPVQLTSFVGREREIAQVKGFLSTTRLLTLTGAGGAGKSRLAFQAAAAALDDFADGVWAVELASIADGALVPPAVASMLSVSEQPGRPISDTLADYLRPRALLLVLDNCEHLRGSCAQLVNALLLECPAVRILATSRVPLSVPGETLWRVPSLSLPDMRRVPSFDYIRPYEAVRLFVERARSVEPAFELASDNAPTVAEVCRHLDGIPLAIELAAARIRVLSVEQIAARLGDRFRLLTGGSPSALPRHQTLRATMDWSYGLLPANERVLLRRLSVFAGGWTLDAAEAVCSGGGIDPTAVLDLLAQLVDNSLVVVEMQRVQTRYRMLETVREYGRTRLREAEELDTIRRRHRDWYLDLAEQADARLRGPEEDAWLTRLEADHDNLRAAMEWSKGQAGGAEAELRLARALEWFWYLLGHWSEGRARLEEVIARSADAALPGLPKVLVGTVRLAYRQGDIGRAKMLCDRGLALCRQLGDKPGAAQFLVWSAIIAIAEAHHQDAAPLVEEALALCREVGDRWWAVEALAILGTLAMIRGDYERASDSHTESLAISRETGNTNNMTYALRGLGVLAVRQGDWRRAMTHYTECLRLCRGGVKTPGVIAECLEGMARAASLQSAHERAAILFGAAEALFQLLGGHLPLWADEAGHDRYVASTRGGLGETAFAAAWERGRAMTLDQAVDHALATEPAPSKIRGGAALLTVREREVAALVAHGLTNRQIAAKLVVTERTAETHVQNILNKLGFTSRAQVAAWAAEQGLSTPTTP
jgi:non-specific serine/threonine protein kinase